MKKPHNVVIINKRPRRFKVNFYENIKREYDNEGETNDDIRKMK